MAGSRLVTSVAEVVANIEKYERDLVRSPELQAIMGYARSWHGFRGNDGMWHVGPSKFVGYADNSAAAYARSHSRRDGRQTERVLAKWSDEISPGHASFEDAAGAVFSLFARYGRSPNKLFRLNIVRQSGSADAGFTGRARRGLFLSRITVASDVCSGRPTIRGTRVRVSDILDMLAAGVARKEILADYPYLEADDIAAALEYAADAADHRVIQVA